LCCQDIFVTLCTVDDSLYFMCNIEDFKFLADMIQHVPLPLRARYVFCCAPINRKLPFVCTMFLKVMVLFASLLIIHRLHEVPDMSNWFFMTPSIATKFQYVNSLLFSFLPTTCFGPYGPSSSEIYN
jgi:hypothetical protein